MKVIEDYEDSPHANGSKLIIEEEEEASNDH